MLAAGAAVGTGGESSSADPQLLEDNFTQYVDRLNRNFKTYYDGVETRMQKLDCNFKILCDKSKVLMAADGELSGGKAPSYQELEDAISFLREMIEPAEEELQLVERELEEWPRLADSLQAENWPVRYEQLVLKLDEMESNLIDYGYVKYEPVLDEASLQTQLDSINEQVAAESNAAASETVIDEKPETEESQNTAVHVSPPSPEDDDISLETLGLSTQSMQLLLRRNSDMTEEKAAGGSPRALSEYFTASTAAGDDNSDDKLLLKPISQIEYDSLGDLIHQKITFKTFVNERFRAGNQNNNQNGEDDSVPLIIISNAQLEVDLKLSAAESKLFLLILLKLKRLKSFEGAQLGQFLLVLNSKQ